MLSPGRNPNCLSLRKLRELISAVILESRIFSKSFSYCVQLTDVSIRRWKRRVLNPHEQGNHVGLFPHCGFCCHLRTALKSFMRNVIAFRVTFLMALFGTPLAPGVYLPWAHGWSWGPRLGLSEAVDSPVLVQTTPWPLWLAQHYQSASGVVCISCRCFNTRLLPHPKYPTQRNGCFWTAWCESMYTSKGGRLVLHTRLDIGFIEKKLPIW